MASSKCNYTFLPSILGVLHRVLTRRHGKRHDKKAWQKTHSHSDDEEATRTEERVKIDILELKEFQTRITVLTLSGGVLRIVSSNSKTHSRDFGTQN